MARLATDMVFKVYGTASFTDRSWLPFEFTIAYGRRVAAPYNNIINYAQLGRDAPNGKGPDHTVGFPLYTFYHTVTPGVIQLDPHSPVSEGADTNKVVSDFTMMMTGIVTYDDRSWDSFAVEYVNGVTDLTPGTTVADWAAMVVLDQAKLVSGFETLVDLGHATIS